MSCVQLRLCASGWSSLWEGPAVSASLGVTFKVSLLAEAHPSFVLSQRPLGRGRPIFGSKESCLPHSVLHLFKELKSSWGVNWGSLPRSFQLFQIPGFTRVTYTHFKGRTGLDRLRSFSFKKDDFPFRGLDIYIPGCGLEHRISTTS